MSSRFFFFLPVSSLSSSRAAPVAILPSALFVERFSLGAGWAFSDKFYLTYAHKLPLWRCSELPLPQSFLISA